MQYCHPPPAGRSSVRAMQGSEEAIALQALADVERATTKCREKCEEEVRECVRMQWGALTHGSAQHYCDNECVHEPVNVEVVGMPAALAAKLGIRADARVDLHGQRYVYHAHCFWKGKCSCFVATPVARSDKVSVFASSSMCTLNHAVLRAQSLGAPFAVHIRNAHGCEEANTLHFCGYMNDTGYQYLGDHETTEANTFAGHDSGSYVCLLTGITFQ